MGNWVVDENNEQVVDNSDNRVYVGQIPEGGEGGGGAGDVPQGSDPQPPHIISKDHYHGLERREVSNYYKVPVDHDACVASLAPDTNFGSNPVLGVREHAPTIEVNTIAFVDSNPDTITDSGSGFTAAAFQVGGTITVTGSSFNNGTYTIAGVAAGVLTLVGGDSLTNEAAGNLVRIEQTNLPWYVYVYIKATGLANFSSGHTLDQGFLNIKRIYGVGTEQISFIEVRRVTSAWDESTITWNTKASEGAEYFNIEMRDITEDTWISIDVKDWLQNWVDGVWTNHGLVIKPIYTDPIKRFHSSEATDILTHPYFSLYYFPY